MFDNLRQQYRNARTCIAQIRRGEWVPIFCERHGEHLTAVRGSLWLMIGNGSFFCDTFPAYFGPIFCHWVWWAAARKLKCDADAMRRRAPILEDSAP